MIAAVTGPSPGDVLKAGSELLGQLAQLAMVVLEQLGLLKDSDRETAGFATGDHRRVGRGGAAGAPGGDDADLGVGEWLAGIDVEVDAAQQRG